MTTTTNLFNIVGDIPAKKNNYRSSGGKFYIDKKANKGIYGILVQLASSRNRPKTPIVHPIRVVVEIYTPNMRRDLDNMITTLLDCMQKAGIIKNDNQVVALSGMKIRSKESSARIVINFAV